MQDGIRDGAPPAGPSSLSGGGAATVKELSEFTELPTMGMPIRQATHDGVVTIGVAIEIPAPVGPELEQYRADFGDPLASAIPAHVTLLPPTLVPGLDEAVLDHLEPVAARTRPFRMRLRGSDSFRPVSPVVFVKVWAGAAGCDALQQRIRTGPLSRDLTFPYHPHVTVAHHLDDDALDRAQRTLRDYEAGFDVEGLGLYEHGQDKVWRLRRRFAFRSAP